MTYHWLRVRQDRWYTLPLYDIIHGGQYKGSIPALIIIIKVIVAAYIALKSVNSVTPKSLQHSVFVCKVCCTTFEV